MNMKITSSSFTNDPYKQLKQVKWIKQPSHNNIELFDNISINNNTLGNLNLCIREYKDGFNRLIIEIKNHLNKVFGTELISLDKPQEPMLGYLIQVLPEYRQKGVRLGEILRLASIMQMSKNKVPYIEIYSKDTAVYFHAKYKFLPAEKIFEGRNSILDTIINDNSATFSDLKERATIFTETIEKNRNNAELQRQLCLDTNELAIEYIQRALNENNPEKTHPFKRGMTMKLTFENIQNNKDFFNNLFNKYGIDYKI